MKPASYPQIVFLLATALIFASSCSQADTPQAELAQKESGSAASPQATTFDGKRSYKYLKKICSFGNRMSGSAGMQEQQQLLEKHFVALGAQVDYQKFRTKHPLSGRTVPMANIIVQWHPEAKERILLCAHYDTRPLPDRDPNPRRRREGVFLGANDGASGVALLMELGHHVAQLPDRYGLDFVFFDGEELVYDNDRDEYFHGSKWFAKTYRAEPPEYQYLQGVLFDMVADKQLGIRQEGNSLNTPETRQIVKEIWGTAKELGVKEFIHRAGVPVLDDHIPLNRIAKIPTIDIIDFEYPVYPRPGITTYWHTTSDAPGRCSAASLDKVGRVIQAWLTTKR